MPRMFGPTEGALPPQWGADAPELVRLSAEETREFNGSRHAHRGTPVASFVAGIVEIAKRRWVHMAVDPEKGTIVLGEVGRWHVKDGQTEITRRTIDVEPAVKGGDFVTVRVEQMGKRPIATRIAVTVTAE